MGFGRCKPAQSENLVGDLGMVVYLIFDASTVM